MNKSEEFQEKYQKELETIPLPNSLKNFLKIINSLKSSEHCSTFLVRDTLLNRECVLKCATGSFGGLLKQEYRILSDLNAKNSRGIPCPYRLFTEADAVYLLREYIPGKSLYEKIENNTALTEAELRVLGLKLCKMLHSFQSMTPPLIHRDIKPENIILDKDGNLFIIDFGSARYYREGGQTDTFLVGSVHTAAPEQYGIAQTDLRTDIFAVGKTLWYAAAGSYDSSMLENAPISRSLKKIIRKAAEFDPQKRYISVGELENALCPRRFSRNTAVAAGVFFLFAAGLGTGILLEQNLKNGSRMAKEDKLVIMNENAKLPEAVDEEAPVIFREPLIEQAVRQQLALDAQTPITESMLLEITTLVILENDILPGIEHYNGIDEVCTDKRFYPTEERGEIRSLADFAHMKHLLKAVICNQHIGDLTPLENLPIQQLHLGNNDITDISPVKTLYNLTDFSILGNPIGNLDVLTECSGVKILNISDCNLENLDFLRKMKLEELSVINTRAEEGWDCLKEKKELVHITVGDLDEAMAEMLRSMEALESIRIRGEYRLPNLAALKELPKLTAIAGNGFTTLEGIGELPALEQLYLDRSEVHDLTPILEAEKLKQISISDQTVFDLTPIAVHPGLENVTCTEAQMQRILELNPEPGFTFNK